MKGQILNQVYQVQELLGKRGGRESLLAKDLRTETLVVIKLLKFGLDTEWEDFKLFEREAQTLKNLAHPAIPQYLDYFDLDLPHCRGFALVQSYIAAPSLATALSDGRTFSESEIKQIAEAILEILIYLHQRNPPIIHRDIKPSNILLSDRSGNSVGDVYLIDFGAVQNLAATERNTITIVGTYGYMPPEQFGGRTTPVSDLYSLGATLIYLATGIYPADLPSKDGKIIFESSVSLSSTLINWLSQMTEPSQDRRFPSATVALQALKCPLADTSQATKIIQQPAKSKIKLHKTPEVIEILIPPRGLTPELIFLIPFAVAWNSFLIFWSGATLLIPFPINIVFALFSLPFWTVGLGMIAGIVFTLFVNTKLKITSRQIALTYECWQIKYTRPQPRPRNSITKIERTAKHWGKDSDGQTTEIPPKLIVWAAGEAYELNNRFVNYHQEQELDWLAQELSEWLKLPITIEKK